MSEYLFYFILGGLILIGIGVGYVWKKGLLGTANEEKIKAIRAQVATEAKEELDRVAAKAKAQLDHWDRAFEAKVAARMAKEPPTLTDVVARNRTDSISAAFDLYKKEALTKEQYDKIVADIMK